MPWRDPGARLLRYVGQWKKGKQHGCRAETTNLGVLGARGLRVQSCRVSDCKGFGLRV